MTDLWSLRQEILLLVSVAGFLFPASSRGKMFIRKDGRLPAFLGWILWKIPHNNCPFAIVTHIVHIRQVSWDVDTKCIAWPNYLSS